MMENRQEGLIYLTFPLAMVRCGESDLQRLLIDIDAQFWQEPRYARISVIEHDVEEPRPSYVTDGLWLREALADRALAGPILDVLEGRAARLRVPTEAALRRQALQGDAVACYALGDRLGEAGRPWLERAATLGHLGAMEALGDLPWLERLATVSTDAWRLRRTCCQLARLSEQASNLPAAIAYLERSQMALNSDRTCLRLGRLYRAVGDRVQAVTWLEVATAGLAHDALNPDEQVAAMRELVELEGLLAPADARRAHEMAHARLTGRKEA